MYCLHLAFAYLKALSVRQRAAGNFLNLRFIAPWNVIFIGFAFFLMMLNGVNVDILS